ncbi:Predicted lipoprotein with conserved Yx(FWY)xxD motif [Frankineae bacterium MT45]|nr:Predicted lipoprotein with conserved Yx(FWY)xxD motif [Frankineae bacterium MT45]
MAGCSSDKPKADPLVVATPPATVLIATTTIPGLGSVLSSGGRPLYVFSPDHHAVVTCTGACSGTWPPLRTAGQARAGAGVKAGDLGTVTSEGFDVVTFQGWPLYRYAGDTDSTQARGQALFLNGGPWYTIRADGEIVTTGSDRS